MNELTIIKDQQVWESLESEIARVLNVMEERELTQDDVKEVRKLVKGIESHITKYNKEMSSYVASYKKLVKNKLEELGYHRITQMMDQIKAEKAKEKEKIIYEKKVKFEEIVKEVLEQTTKLKHSSIAPHVYYYSGQCFPHLQSSAKNHQTLDVEKTKTFLQHVYQVVDAQLTNMMVQLPMHSVVMQQVSKALTTGDVSHVDKLSQYVKDDQSIIEDLYISTHCKTEEDAIAFITQIVHSEKTTKEKLYWISKIVQQTTM